MSAWIVSRAHIDVLVQATLDRGIATGDPTEIGKVLWRENHRSINYRYGERSRTPSYVYRVPSNRIDLPGLYKAIACYESQTCEHPTYESSKAFRWMNALRKAVVAVVGNNLDNDYPWGYEEAHVHAKVTA